MTETVFVVRESEIRPLPEDAVLKPGEKALFASSIIRVEIEDNTHEKEVYDNGFCVTVFLPDATYFRSIRHSRQQAEDLASHLIAAVRRAHGGDTA